MKRNVPKLRFKDFNEEWIKTKIGDLYNDLKAGSTPSKLNSKYFKGDIPWITSGELKSKYVYTTMEYITEEAKKSANLKLYDEGTLFIAITGLEAPGTRGSCAINKIKATTNQSCLAFQKSSKVYNEFLYYWYNLYGEYIGITYTQGTKQQSLNNKLVSELKIIIPSLPEQEKIANFLTKVDSLIEEQTGKVTDLEKYKKSMMQKIFSQQIRFKDDNGCDYPEWEEEILGSYLDTISSGKTKNKSDKGKYNVYGSTGIIGYSNEFDYNGEYVLIARVGANAGTVNKINEQCGISDNTLVVKCKDKLNYIFLNYMLINYNLSKLIFGSGQPLVTGGQLKRLRLKVPSIQEQTKIANFLSNIDRIIEEEKGKLEDLRTWKKGLLQQMFV